MYHDSGLSDEALYWEKQLMCFLVNYAISFEILKRHIFFESQSTTFRQASKSSHVNFNLYWNVWYCVLEKTEDKNQSWLWNPWEIIIF